MATMGASDYRFELDCFHFFLGSGLDSATPSSSAMEGFAAAQRLK